MLLLAQHSLAGPLLGLLLWLSQFAALPGVSSGSEGQEAWELGTLSGGLWGQKGQCLPESPEREVSSSYRRVQFMECEGGVGDGRSQREEESPNNLAALGQETSEEGRLSTG